MKNKYDFLIVGAGPAGMFAALEISKLTKNKKKILLVDIGEKIENRKPTQVMCGIGGAGTFSDGKMHFSPTLSHEKAFHLIDIKDYQLVLNYVDQVLTDYGVVGEYYPKDTIEVQKLVEEAQKNDIDLLPRRIRHCGTDKLKEVMQKFENDLESKNVEILPNTEIIDLIIEDGACIGVITKELKKIYANKILLAPGRIKATWLQQMAKKHDLGYVYDMVEVGVRVEFPSFIMNKFSEQMYEAVFKIRTHTFDDIVRTFCPCPNGMVAIENYDDFVCVNGHSNSDHKSENSNFAFLCEVRLTDPVENTIAYAKSIAQVASTIGGGKPLIQRLSDLKRGQRSTWTRIEKSLIKPSLMESTPGDLAMALPYRILKNILEGLEQLDAIMPGINAGSTLLYAPEVKFRTTKFATKKTLETNNVKNLFVAGDAAGLSGSITGAACTGVMAGRGMVE
jgi:uncharacterized FAD-dependent dehydrogenase